MSIGKIHVVHNIAVLMQSISMMLFEESERFDTAILCYLSQDPTKGLSLVVCKYSMVKEN